ncbi:aldehyde dehydrogenase (NADP(+)) [Nocardia salmonicida]|uniref:aldehyde dehydrogenase (NADP(+)) n=1 Tax=Nocardia salmonicida TaxID=53431 RepID=UPI0009ED65D1|nr:aldehyde dehydrogenase (NADP(+)) [Nocardia salmonicida]
MFEIANYVRYFEQGVVVEEVEVWSVNPRTGIRRGQIAQEASPEAIDRVVRAAHATRAALSDRTVRARFLRSAADVLDSEREVLAAEADAETALGVPRLLGEIARTSGQLRAFADAVDAGEFLGIIIDHADTGRTPPTPDLRRYKIALGVVAVYSASNFPFAFSVAGGDTASAIAAGCPVVVKAHPGHPATSELTLAALHTAARRCGIPPEVVQLVHGFDAGVELIHHPEVAGAGFTGSVRGGRALFDAAAARSVPIPFHGELGSLNPVIVTALAAAERARQIGAALAASVLLGNGQFCVKPGLVLVPDGDHGDLLIAELTRHMAGSPPATLLDARIEDNFVTGVAARTNLPQVTTLIDSDIGDHSVSCALLSAPADALIIDSHHDLLLEECFGPMTVLVRYANLDEATAVLDRLSGSLTATLQVAAQEASVPGTTAALLDRMSTLAGRVVVDDWPTGVAVTPAQHHGGPYPASTSTFTSVGTTAIERWLRPVAYQNTTNSLLPPELQEGNPLNLPRLVDGIHVQRANSRSDS